MKKNIISKLRIFTITICSLCITSNVFPQVTIGSGLVPNKGALLDLKENNADDGGQTSTKGLGLPRVALVAIDKLEPCTDTNAKSKLEHTGLTIYNTTDNSATAATLKEGTYFWDGNSWQLFGLKNSQGFGPWYQIDSPTIPSRNVNSNSYIDAKIAVGGKAILEDATLSIHGNTIAEGEFILRGTQIVQERVTIGSFDKPDPNSLLDLKTNADGSSTKGFLLPRVFLQTLSSPLPIDNTSLTEGMIVYNTNQSAGAKGIYYWGDSKWNSMNSGSSSNSGPWNVANTTEGATSNTSNIYQMGNVGIGTDNPTAPLHIKSVKGADPVKIEGVNKGTYKDNSILTLNDDGIVRKIASSDIGNDIINATSVPVPNIYELTKDLDDFLSDEGKGDSHIISNLIAIKAAIKGMTLNTSTSEVHFPTGTYQITVVYEAEHDAPGCTLSSYFIDFPTGVRIHSTAAHDEGSTSSHGGSIIFTVILPEPTDWAIKLGRGQSGNCEGPGMVLLEESTQITIFRIGDA